MKKIIILIIFLSILALGGVMGYLFYKKPVESVSRPNKSVYIPSGSLFDCSFDDNKMLELFNSVRDNDLAIDPYLEHIAQNRSDSISYKLDNHVGFRIVAKEGYFDNREYSLVSEILASNHCPSAMSLFMQWKDSPPHWSAINNERYDVVGIGFNSQGTAVAIFWRFTLKKEATRNLVTAS